MTDNDKTVKSVLWGRIRENKDLLYLGGAALVMTLAVLSPVLNSGFTGDDGHNSMVRSLLRLNQQDIFSFTWSYMRQWIRNEGRLYPLAWFGYTVFAVFANVRIYKASLVLFTLADVALFGYFIKRFTRSSALGLLSLCLAPLFFQLHEVTDPIMSYHWMLQLLFGYVIGSLLLLMRYLETGRKRWLISSVVLYAMSLLTYEITYPLWLLHAVVIAVVSERREVRDVCRKTAPFFFMALTAAGASFLLRRVAQVTIDPAYRPHFQVQAYLLSLAQQVSAAIPLSYRVFDPHKAFSGFEAFFRDRFSVIHLVILIGMFVIFLEALSRTARKTVDPGDRTRLKGLWILGFLLWILPGVLIALSPRYQQWSGWGYGHLNIFLSYFGFMAMVLSTLATVFQEAARRFPGLVLPMSAVIALAAGGIGVLTYNDNDIIVERVNQQCLYPRSVLENAMKRGVFRGVPAGSGLFVEQRNAWDQRAFYQLGSKSDLRFVAVPGTYLQDARTGAGKDAPAAFRPQKFGPEDNVLYLTYGGPARSVGYAILGRVNALVADDARIHGARSDQLSMYVETPFYSPARFALFGRQADKSTPNDYKPFVRYDDQMKIVSSRPNGKIFSLDFPDKWVDLKSLRVAMVSGKGGDSWFSRADDELYLPKDGSILSRGGVSGPIGTGGLSFDPIRLNASFSVELVVMPFRSQPSSAHIIGNHPGLNYFEGFVLQQEGAEENRYVFTFGDGGGWRPSARIDLSPEEWHHLVIVVERGNILIYRNGALSSTLDAGGTVKNSQMPLYLGNWMNGDRLFNGLINEFRILNRALSPAEVRKDWQIVQQHLRQGSESCPRWD